MSIPEAVREECECDSLYLLDFLALHLHPLLHNYLLATRVLLTLLTTRAE